MSIIGKILFSLSMLLMFFILDLLMVLFGSLIIQNPEFSFGYLFISAFYIMLATAILFFHWFCLIGLIDFFNLNDPLCMLICNITYRDDPCNTCLSLAICQRDRMCDDFKKFIYKKRNLFEKIKWKWLL